jgi:hypothetical protein
MFCCCTCGKLVTLIRHSTSCIRVICSLKLHKPLHTNKQNTTRFEATAIRTLSSGEKETRLRTGKPSPSHQILWTYYSDCESTRPTHPRGKNPKHSLVIYKDYILANFKHFKVVCVPTRPLTLNRRIHKLNCDFNFNLTLYRF